MTVTTDRTQQGIVGNGAQTVFHYTIPYQSSTTLFVYSQDNNAIPSTETLLRSSVDYTLVGIASPDITVTLIIGGASIFQSPPSALTTIWVQRETPITQMAYDLVPTSPWVPIPTEQAIDATVLMIQELDDKVSKAIKVGDFDTPANITLTPDPDKYLKWDSTGTNIISGSISDAQITDLTSRVTVLESDMALVKTEIDNLETTVTTSIGDLQNQILSNDADILALQTTVNSHGIRISNLETAIANIPPNQSADITDLQDRMEIVEDEIVTIKDDIVDIKAELILIDERLDLLEVRNLTHRRYGRVPLLLEVYPIDTIIPGLVFDFDFTSSSILYLEIRRADIGDERVETFMYSASWANGIWNIVLTQANIQTAPTGVNIVLVHDVLDRAVQLYFNAPTALGGTYDPNNSWIAWTTEDMVRFPT